MFILTCYIRSDMVKAVENSLENLNLIDQPRVECQVLEVSLKALLFEFLVIDLNKVINKIYNNYTKYKKIYF